MYFQGCLRNRHYNISLLTGGQNEGKQRVYNFQWELCTKGQVVCEHKIWMLALGVEISEMA